MMAHRLRLAVLFTLSFAGGGCGTVVNLVRPDSEKVFGGVRQDVEWIDKLAHDEPTGLNPLANSGAGGASLAAAVFLIGPFVDIPLSFIGDALTYPLARWLESER